MSEIILISDTSCDLGDKLTKENQVTLVPFYVSFDQETYYKEITELSIENFYKRMREEKIFPKTSLPSITDYLEVFTPVIMQGQSIICVCLSSYFSGSYNSATNARELILENYPNAQIAIINSLNATGGQGLLVAEIARMIKDGIDFDTIVKTSEILREKAKIFFYVDNLEYLEHGGRIGKASALLGTMLNVKPIIYLANGQLFPSSKVRGKKKAITKIVQQTKEHVGDNPQNYHYIIGHADALDDARKIYDELTQTIDAPIPNHFFFIGTTIGVNTGPDTCGICLIPKYESLLNR